MPPLSRQRVPIGLLRSQPGCCLGSIVVGSTTIAASAFAVASALVGRPPFAPGFLRTCRRLVCHRDQLQNYRCGRIELRSASPIAP